MTARCISRHFQSLMAVTIYLCLSGIAVAKYIGCDPPLPGVSSTTADRSGTIISLTESNLIERQNVCGINCSICSTCPKTSARNTHGLLFTITYNSRDADGSRAQMDI